MPVIPFHVFTIAGSTTNVYHTKEGEGLPKHTHVYPHITYCANGSIVVRKEGKELRMNKTSAPVLLVANEWHEIEALEDETVFVNVFAEGQA